MQRTCVKCGHLQPNATGSDLEACPNCSALYAKALPTRASPVPRGTPMSGFGGTGEPSTRPPDADTAPRATARQFVADMLDPPAAGPRAGFVERMRRESLYPTFRGAVQLVYAVMVALAVVICIGAVLSAVFFQTVGATVGALVFALLLWLFARVCKEGSLMLADLCDASVRVASRQDQ